MKITIKTASLLVILLLLTNKCFSQQPKTTTIGIGYFTDTPSNISYQYSVYRVLADNPLFKKDTTEIIPMLTLRRGLTEYFINGYMSQKKVVCNIWHNGKLETTIKEVIDTKDKKKLLAQFYDRLNNAIGDMLSKKERNRYYAHVHPATNVVRKYYSKLNSLATRQGAVKMVDYILPDITKGDVKYNMPLYAENTTPLSDKDQGLITAYAYSIGGLGEEEQQYMLSDEFRKLSDNEQERYVAGKVRASAVKEAKMFFPRHKAMTSVYKNGILSAESVSDIYTSDNVSGFLFNSSLVDEKLRYNAKKLALPLWKRAGTAVTYLQAGNEFNQDNLPDVAIECYSSALLMVDALNVSPSFKHYLKSKTFEAMAIAYQKNKQGASAYICNKLSALHRHITYSNAMVKQDAEYKEGVDKVVTFFNEVEANAKKAKSERSKATWAAIGNAMSAVGSTMQDAQNGLKSPSAATQTYVQDATNSLIATSDISSASVNATGKAATVFEKAFGDLVKEIQADNNNFSSTKPLFATDFAKLMCNEDIVKEQQNEILEVAKSTPALYDIVNRYCEGKDSKLLKSIYVNFAKLEINIYSKEASGQITDETNIALK